MILSPSDEKLCCEAEKEDDVVDERLIQKKLRLREQARKTNNYDPSRLQKLASGSNNGDQKSKTSKSMVLSPFDEKLCSEVEKEDHVVDDNRLIQKKLTLREQARKANNDEPSCRQKLASRSNNGDETSKTSKSMVLSPSDESNLHISVGDRTTGQDCLLHDDAMEEAMKSNEQFENLV